MLRHADPLVFNADAGQWQNASYPDPSGSPIGIGIGSETGSQVLSQPLVNMTVYHIVDARTFTIIAATIYGTGAASEAQPGLICTMVYDEGGASEQLAHLILSGLANGNGHGQLMTSDSLDAVWQARHETGTLANGSGHSADFSFTPVVSQNSGDQTVHLHAPYIIRMDEGASNGFVLTSDSVGNGTWQAPAARWHPPVRAAAILPSAASVLAPLSKVMAGQWHVPAG